VAQLTPLEVHQVASVQQIATLARRADLVPQTAVLGQRRQQLHRLGPQQHQQAQVSVQPTQVPVVLRVHQQ